MKRFQLFILKNRMLGANWISNIIGLTLIQVIILLSESQALKSYARALDYVDWIFIPSAFATGTALTVIYEWPTRRYLQDLAQRRAITVDLLQQARRRLLNEPFYLIAVNFGLWLIAGITYGAALYFLNAESHIIHRAFVMNLITGLITCTAAFFVLEHLLQRRMVVHFFPAGHLSETQGAIRVRIRTRLLALFCACNLVPLLAIGHLFQRSTHSADDSLTILGVVQHSVFINSVVFILVGFWLTLLVSENITRPLGNITRVLHAIRRGDFSRRVQVTSNDEIGYTGDVINEMTDGLVERDRMRQSLALAMEVQQRLLPAEIPRVRGFDLSGTSIYCDQTGGDYFDYIQLDATPQGRLAVVVGDVSDHGIPSALIMISARAFLRYHVARSEEITAIVGDVNRQLTRDLSGSGHFMTLFLCAIDPRKGTISWVRAGHDPALCYDPARDCFTELDGKGLPMGIFEEITLERREMRLVPGQLLVIGTDGIWECTNDASQRFGKERLRSLIRQSHHLPAEQVVNTIIKAVDAFRGDHPYQDDVTLVVIRVQGEG